MSKNGCDLPQEVREDVIPLTNPEIENLVDGVDFEDHFEGLERMTDLVDGDDFQDNLRADLVDGVNFQDHFEGIERRADLLNDNSSDSDFAQYIEDDVESNAPSEALDDIVGSDVDNIFDERPSTKTEMINKLKGMLKKARRRSSRMKSFQIANEEENSVWYTDPDDDEDIDTPVYLNGKVHKQSIFKEGDTMKNKNFERLMQFENVKVFRGALRDWIVRNGYELNFEKNEKSRVTEVCKAEGCTWRIHASNVQGSPLYMASDRTAATPQTGNPLIAATHEAANSTPAAATRLSSNHPTSVHQNFNPPIDAIRRISTNPLLASTQNANTPTAAISQFGVNPRATATHETTPTENRGQVYEGRRNAALLGTSNWKELQQAQSISTSQAASDGQNVQKRIRKPTEIQVLQNIKESSKKRIWKS